MDARIIAAIITALATFGAGVLTVFHAEIVAMLRRTSLSVRGAWIGTGRDVEALGTAAGFARATYEHVVVRLRQTGRRVTGTGSVQAGGKSLSALLRGEVVADDRVCMIFTSAPPSRDYGVVILSVEPSGTRMMGQVVAREMAGSGLVRFEMTLEKERTS